MIGKNKCKILKQIRQKIADENEIPFVTQECAFQGACNGTCPKCEAELRELEQALEKRRRLGKTVVVAAVAATLGLGLAGCKPGNGSGETKPAVTQPSTTEELLQGEVAELETKGVVEAPGTQTQTTEAPTELLGDVAFLPESVTPHD